MTTLNIAIAEILEKGEISKRTEVELKETDWSKDNIPYHNGMELEGLAYHLVETMKEEDSAISTTMAKMAVTKDNSVHFSMKMLLNAILERNADLCRSLEGAISFMVPSLF